MQRCFPNARTVGGPPATMLGDMQLADPVSWELPPLHLEQGNLFSRYRRAAR